jgi:hypothetical protein
VSRVSRRVQLLQRIPRALLLLVACTAALLATLDVLGHSDGAAVQHTTTVASVDCAIQACAHPGASVAMVSTDEELACLAVLLTAVVLFALRRLGVARPATATLAWRRAAHTAAGRSPPRRGLLLTTTAVSLT